MLPQITLKEVILKNIVPFTNCISEIKNTQIDHTKDTDIAMPMYNLIEHSDNCPKTSGSLWKYCKDIPAVNNNGNIVNFNGANSNYSFYSKATITGQNVDDGEIDNTKIMVLLKNLGKFWRILKMSLINSAVNLILTWSADCVIASNNVANQGATFTITEARLYGPVVTLSTQDNEKLLPQLKSGFRK